MGVPTAILGPGSDRRKGPLSRWLDGLGMTSRGGRIEQTDLQFEHRYVPGSRLQFQPMCQLEFSGVRRTASRDIATCRRSTSR